MRGIRQHVNPLGLHYSIPRAQPLTRPQHLPADAPVEVELGCADAQFSFQLARHAPDTWVCGLEIREPWVARNLRRVARENIQNLSFGYVNLNVDLDRVFAPRSVDRFHLLFPDPWFKDKHKKRRVVEPSLCRTIIEQLRPGGELHIASDIFEITLEAMAEIEGGGEFSRHFENLAGPWSFWRGNPFAVASRREDTTLRRGQRVWRVRYRVDHGDS